MTRPSKSHRSHRPQFTPLEKAFAHSLYRYYHATTQAQRDHAVDQLMDAFRAEKTLTQPSVIASASEAIWGSIRKTQPRAFSPPAEQKQNRLFQDRPMI